MKITKKQFLADTHLPETLCKAVINQLGGWSCFKESAIDITNHGIDGGFCGFFYYSDTVPFALKHLSEIRQLAQDQASNFGMGTLEMIQSFNCLGKDYSLDEIGLALYGGDKEQTQILNALAWYAGEEVSRAYCDMTESC